MLPCIIYYTLFVAFVDDWSGDEMAEDSGSDWEKLPRPNQSSRASPPPPASSSSAADLDETLSKPCERDLVPLSPSAKVISGSASNDLSQGMQEISLEEYRQLHEKENIKSDSTPEKSSTENKSESVSTQEADSHSSELLTETLQTLTPVVQEISPPDMMAKLKAMASPQLKSENEYDSKESTIETKSVSDIDTTNEDDNDNALPQNSDEAPAFDKNNSSSDEQSQESTENAIAESIESQMNHACSEKASEKSEFEESDEILFSVAEKATTEKKDGEIKEQTESGEFCICDFIIMYQLSFIKSC